VSQFVPKPFEGEEEMRFLRRAMTLFVRKDYKDRVKENKATAELWSAIQAGTVQSCIDQEGLANYYNFSYLEALVVANESERKMRVLDAELHISKTTVKEVFHVEKALASYAVRVAVSASQGGLRAVAATSRAPAAPAPMLVASGYVHGPIDPGAAAPMPALPRVTAATLVRMDAAAATTARAIPSSGSSSVAAAVGSAEEDEAKRRRPCPCCSALRHRPDVAETCPLLRWSTAEQPDPPIVRPSRKQGVRDVARRMWEENADDLQRRVRARYGVGGA